MNMIDKDTLIQSLPVNWHIIDALLHQRLPAYTYERAVTVTDAQLRVVHGIGPGRLREWNRFKANNPISNPASEAETLQLEVDQLRADLETRHERVSELGRRLTAKETEVQDLFWQNQKLTYRINQMHKMLDLVRNGLSVPELRRIGFTVDISVAEKGTK